MHALAQNVCDWTGQRSQDWLAPEFEPGSEGGHAVFGMPAKEPARHNPAPNRITYVVE